MRERLNAGGIELLQLASSTRSTDIDDVFLNTMGAAAGYLLYVLVRAAWRSARSTAPRERGARPG